MSNGSLRPHLDLEILDLDGASWREVVEQAWHRSEEIANHRLNHPEITFPGHDDWQRLHRFEYQHFYSGWCAVAFRLSACALHAQVFTAAFERTQGTARNEDLYHEDDALFDFFVKGYSALEGFFYALYALGALLSTSTQQPTIPPHAQFPLLTHQVDPRLRIGPQWITRGITRATYEQVFPDHPLTALLRHLLAEEIYTEWSQIRNILAHRATTAGRDIQLPGFGIEAPPLSVTIWAGELILTRDTALSRYAWLKDTLNNAIRTTAALVRERAA